MYETDPQETLNQRGLFVDRPFSIELFGQAYTFRTKGEVSEVQEVADYVAGQVEKAGAAAEAPSKLDTLILAALNIANEYFEIRRSRQELVRDMDQRCKMLIEHIDNNV
jgi:cell division protein ZapA (FtsZ GTPase activity inhibitor)